jgi:RimJ/RimL family protein N-acetyltransferase
MPKMPQAGRQPPAIPLVTPLAAQRLKPVFIDRWSDRHRVRTLKPEEVTQEIAGWLTAPEIMEGLNAPLVAIRRKSDDAPLGLMMLEIDLRHKVGSLHIVIGEAESRKLSVTVDAVRIMLRHFFRERKMEKLTFQPLARNAAAVAACRSSMLVHEGTLRSHRIDGRTGERLDQMVFGMTVEEYERRLGADIAAGREAAYGGPDLPGRRAP